MSTFTKMSWFIKVIKMHKFRFLRYYYLYKQFEKEVEYVYWD